MHIETYKDISYSVVNFSELDDELRMDSEFFVPNYLSHIPTHKGIEVSSLLQYGTSNSLNEAKVGYSVLRLNELNNCFIEPPSKYCENLSDKKFEEIKLVRNDVVICRTNGNPNNVGRPAIVLEDTNYAYASYLFKVRTKEELLKPHVLVMFLKSKYGRTEVDKHSMTSNQTNFSPGRFKRISIPKFDNTFQEYIEAITLKAYKLRKSSVEVYNKAEKLLLEELKLSDWNGLTKPFSIEGTPFKVLDTENSISIKDVTKIGRLDSEYWQKYAEDLEERIGRYKNGCTFLGNACTIHDDNYLLEADTTYRYVELADIGPAGNIIHYTEEKGYNLPTRARRIVKSGQVIVSSIEGSMDKCAFITDEYDGIVCSNGFFVMDSDVLNSETLTLLLRSEPFQHLLRRGCTGTILTAINKSFLARINIPLVDSSIQKIVKEKISMMYQMIKSSNFLLEQGSKAIDIYIENGEVAAKEYLLPLLESKARVLVE